MAMAMNAILILLLTNSLTQILNVATTIPDIIIFIEIMSMTKTVNMPCDYDYD